MSTRSSGLEEVYRFNGRSNDATAFDAVTGEVKATIELPGKPEFAQVDVKAGRIYNNIEDTNEIAAIIFVLTNISNGTKLPIYSFGQI